MFLLGLDLTGRRVVVVGGGAVGTRRARLLADGGAHVVIVDPDPSPDAVALTTDAGTTGTARAARVELVPRPVQRDDLDGAWLVVAATGDPVRNADVTAWCESRRIWCVNASQGTAGTARLPATITHGDVIVGALSTAEPDPGRVAAVRDALADHLGAGAVDLRRRRRTGVGRVILVGSGPGDPALVPRAGLEALAGADVVVTDRLGATDLLEHLPPDVEVVDVGKDPTNHPVPQEQINDILVERARRGLTVVRLKGGDPYVFGRGGEEVHACRTAGVDVTVVPGISSALSVPALAGIPVTQRGLATSVHITSGHAGADAASLAALAAGSTLVILMGVSALPRICEAAIAHGVRPDLPVAIVEDGSTSLQRVTRATLATAAQVAATTTVRPPAIIVVGAVAAPGFLDDPVCGTSWPGKEVADVQ